MPLLGEVPRTPIYQQSGPEGYPISSRVGKPGPRFCIAWLAQEEWASAPNVSAGSLHPFCGLRATVILLVGDGGGQTAAPAVPLLGGLDTFV